MERIDRSKLSISSVAVVVVVIVVIVIAGVAAALVLTSTSPTSSSSSTVSSTSTASSSMASRINVTFGATLSMTGPLAPFGAEQNWTLWKAVEDINSFGGIPLSNGSHVFVNLQVLDDGSVASKGASNLQALVSTYHSMLILGELGGVQDSVALLFAKQNAIPYIGPVYISQYKTCVTNCTSSWIFSPFQNETNEAHIFLNWFKTEVAPSSNVSIAFFGEGDPAAAFNNAAGEAYAQSLGYSVSSCSDTTFSPGTSTAAFIQCLKNKNVTAVYGLPLPMDAVSLLQNAKLYGYQPKAWLMTRGTAVAPFALPQIGGIGNLSQGVMSSFPWNPAEPYQGNLLGHIINNSQLFSDYFAATHQGPTLEGVYYTEVSIAADAIQIAGNLNNSDIRNALRTSTFQTVMGPVSFTMGGQWIQSESTIMLMQWQLNKAGTPILQILEPTSIATTHYIVYPFSLTEANVTQAWPPGTSTSTASGST